MLLDKKSRAKKKQYMMTLSHNHYTISAVLDRKSSPYVGWFRHSPPAHHSSITASSSSGKEMFVSGRLVGGNPETSHEDDAHCPCHSTSSSSSASSYCSSDDCEYHSTPPPSATLEMLNKLASKVLLIVNNERWSRAFQTPSSQKSTSPWSRSHGLAGTSSSLYSSPITPPLPQWMMTHVLFAVVLPFLSSVMKRVMMIEDGTTKLDLNQVYTPSSSSSSSLSPSNEDDASVSTDGENESDSNAMASTQEPSHPPMDYVVTQMDVSLMARNASRHLDVESILKLPTITYSSKDKKVQDKLKYSDGCASGRPEVKGEEECDLDWSWISVPNEVQIRDDDDAKATMNETSNVGNDDTTGATERCVICLDRFQDGDRLRVLPCKHLFHMGCIDKWLSGTFSYHDCVTSGCPTCKKTLKTDSESPLDAKDGGDGGSLDCISNTDSDTALCEVVREGSVPSWAFMRLGGRLARQSS